MPHRCSLRLPPSSAISSLAGDLDAFEPPTDAVPGMADRRGSGMRLHRDMSEPAALRAPPHQAARTKPTFGHPANPALLRAKLLAPQSVLVLQRRAGNSAVTSLLKPPGRPENASPETSVQRCPGGCAPGAYENEERAEPSLYQGDPANVPMQRSGSQSCRCAESPEAEKSVLQRSTWSADVRPILKSPWAPRVQREEDPQAGKPAATEKDAGAAAPTKAEGSADSGTSAAPKAEESAATGEAAPTVPATTPPATLPSGHTPAPPGMATCPDAPARNLVVLACTAPAAKVPPPKEKVDLPTIPTSNFGGDADRIKFATGLAQCWAERTVKEEIEKRLQADVAAAKKRATDEAAADTKAAVEAATQGLDNKDRAAIQKATADATKATKAAAAKKIADAQSAVTRQQVAPVTAELAKTHRDWLESDYAATIDGALNRRYGPGWLKQMEGVLNRERARITKAKTAKPKVKKGEEPPPTKPKEEIDAEIEAEMTEVRCDQQEWAKNQVEGIARAWAVGRREQLDFQTILQTAAPLKTFAPKYTPAETDKVPIPASVRQGGADANLPPVAPEVAAFLTKLEQVLTAANPPQTYSVGNYSGHGGGSWAGKGFSLDMYIPARKDSRGFWDRSAAISFLLSLDKTASSFGARWRVLYNDFSVAKAVNEATGSRNVEFMGDSSGNLNWHGPDPLILHFHLDLEIPKGAKAPAGPAPAVP
jgi:hypothetical protein